MDEKKDKRVLSIELDENVKKVSITGLGDDNQVVMAQELDEDELDLATGGYALEGPLKCGPFIDPHTGIAPNCPCYWTGY